MMKKILALVMVCAIALCMASCGESDKVEMILDQMEYSMYMSIFSGKQADQYVDKVYSKDGILAVLYDNFNNTTRYYVWGYSDSTMCCDWQWEFVPNDPSSLPPIGSRVQVSGVFTQSKDALDGYWLTNTNILTVKTYEKASGENDMTTMSPTLTRVQLINMMNYPTAYAEKTVRIYGRVASGNKLQHPYYDGSWQIALDYDGTLPAIGTYVTVVATVSGTGVSDVKLVVQSVTPD